MHSGSAIWVRLGRAATGGRPFGCTLSVSLPPPLQHVYEDVSFLPKSCYRRASLIQHSQHFGLWNDTTLLATGFPGFNTRRKRSTVTTTHFDTTDTVLAAIKHFNRGDAPCSTRRVLKRYFLVARLVLVTRFRSCNTRRATGLKRTRAVHQRCAPAGPGLPCRQCPWPYAPAPALALDLKTNPSRNNRTSNQPH